MFLPLSVQLLKWFISLIEILNLWILRIFTNLRFEDSSFDQEQVECWANLCHTFLSLRSQIGTFPRQFWHHHPWVREGQKLMDFCTEIILGLFPLCVWGPKPHLQTDLWEPGNKIFWCFGIHYTEKHWWLVSRYKYKPVQLFPLTFLIAPTRHFDLQIFAVISTWSCPYIKINLVSL